MNVSLYQAAAALDANSRWQEVIGENLAANSLPGFKKFDLTMGSIPGGSFQTGELSGAEPHVLPKAQLATHFTPGEIRHTGEETELALEGTGFFEIQMPNGEAVYTRNGSFTTDSSGQLVTKDGHPVLGVAGAIQIDPRNPQPLTITDEGEIRQGAEFRGQLRIVDFNDPQKLTRLGTGYYRMEHPGLAAFEVEQPQVRQGFLESSNISSAQEMSSLIMAMRMHEANQKVIQEQDKRMGNAIQQLAGVS